MDQFLTTMRDFLKVAFLVVLWLAIVASFIAGLDDVPRGGGALAGGALVAATLLYLFKGTSNRHAPKG